MGISILIILVPMLDEALTEYGKTIVDMFNNEGKRTAIIQCITVALGIGLCFAFNFDVFELIGVPVNHVIGMIITGILGSRGSNYVSDFVGKLGQKTVG